MQPSSTCAPPDLSWRNTDHAQAKAVAAGGRSEPTKRRRDSLPLGAEEQLKVYQLRSYHQRQKAGHSSLLLFPVPQKSGNR